MASMSRGLQLLLLCCLQVSRANLMRSNLGVCAHVCIGLYLLFSPFSFLNNLSFCSRQVRNPNMTGCPQPLIITVLSWKKEAATGKTLH